MSPECSGVRQGWRWEWEECLYISQHKAQTDKTIGRALEGWGLEHTVIIKAFNRVSHLIKSCNYNTLVQTEEEEQGNTPGLMVRLWFVVLNLHVYILNIWELLHSCLYILEKHAWNVTSIESFNKNVNDDKFCLWLRTKALSSERCWQKR